jgi:hypothetical protein
VIRVLVSLECRREDDRGTQSPDDLCELQRVRRFHLELSIAIESNEIDRGAEELRRTLSFGCADRRRAVAPGLAARADNQVNPPPAERLCSDNAAASELDVVRMRTECEERLTCDLVGLLHAVSRQNELVI